MDIQVAIAIVIKTRLGIANEVGIEADMKVTIAFESYKIYIRSILSMRITRRNTHQMQ